MSTLLEGAGARPKDNYYQDSEDNEVRFREADEEYQRLNPFTTEARFYVLNAMAFSFSGERVKADFARIARARRTSPHSRSDSSRSPSPLGRQSQRRSTNLPKFRIATFYATDVELWFNQIETQFALHQINEDDERHSLTCAALSGEVASDVRDVLVVSTAAFHARVRGSVPGLGGLKETKNVSSPSTCESQYCGEPP